MRKNIILFVLLFVHIFFSFFAFGVKYIRARYYNVIYGVDLFFFVQYIIG